MTKGKIAGCLNDQCSDISFDEKNAKNGNNRNNADNTIPVVLGMVILAIGLALLGKAIGIIPESINLLIYACSCCLVFFGSKIIIRQFTRKTHF